MFIRGQVDGKGKVLAILTLVFILLIILLVMAFLLANQSIQDEMRKYVIVSVVYFIHLLILVISMAWRLLSTNIIRGIEEYQECFSNGIILFNSLLINENYTVQRWITYSLAFQNSLVSYFTYNRQDFLDYEKYLDQTLFSALAVLQMIFGILICGFFLFEFNIKKVCFPAQNIDKYLLRRNTFIEAIGYCILTLIFFFAKFILPLAYSMKRNFAPYVYLSMFQAGLIVRILYFLIFQFSYLISYPQFFDDENNILYFNSWFVLFKSIIRSKYLRFTKINLAILFLGQAVIGQIFYPVTQIMNILNDSTYSVESLIFFDSIFYAAGFIYFIIQTIYYCPDKQILPIYVKSV